MDPIHVLNVVYAIAIVGLGVCMWTCLRLEMFTNATARDSLLGLLNILVASISFVNAVVIAGYFDPRF